MKKWMQVITMAMMTLAVWQVQAGAEAAKAVIEQMNNTFLQKIKGKETQILNNNDLIVEIAQTDFLPHFDTVKMAKYILGRGVWNAATDEQKDRFVKAFSNMLVASYAKTLLKMNIDRVEILDAQLGVRPILAQVFTKVYRAGDPEGISVISRMVQDKKTGQWRIYDVSVDGVSILVSYRKTYAQEVQVKGLEQVTKELEAFHL